jgi:hypothetical protein
MFRYDFLKAGSKIPLSGILAALFAVSAGTFIIFSVIAASHIVEELTIEPDEQSPGITKTIPETDRRANWLRPTGSAQLAPADRARMGFVDYILKIML